MRAIPGGIARYRTSIDPTQDASGAVIRPKSPVRTTPVGSTDDRTGRRARHPARASTRLEASRRIIGVPFESEEEAPRDAAIRLATLMAEATPHRAAGGSRVEGLMSPGQVTYRHRCESDGEGCDHPNEGRNSRSGGTPAWANKYRTVVRNEGRRLRLADPRRRLIGVRLRRSVGAIRRWLRERAGRVWRRANATERGHRDPRVCNMTRSAVAGRFRTSAERDSFRWEVLQLRFPLSPTSSARSGTTMLHSAHPIVSQAKRTPTVPPLRTPAGSSAALSSPRYTMRQ
jgi:hypothetical protein